MTLRKKVRWALLQQTLGQEAKWSVRRESLWSKYGLLIGLDVQTADSSWRTHLLDEISALVLLLNILYENAALIKEKWEQTLAVLLGAKRS